MVWRNLKQGFLIKRIYIKVVFVVVFLCVHEGVYTGDGLPESMQHIDRQAQYVEGMLQGVVRIDSGQTGINPVCSKTN